MNPSAGQSKIIVILSAVLIAALLAAGAVIFLLPNTDNSNAATSSTFSSITNAITGLFSSNDASTPQATQAPITPQFNVETLDRNAYDQLNTSLIDNGLLPTRPDPAAGKANPFL